MALGAATALGPGFAGLCEGYAAGRRTFHRERTLVGVDGQPVTVCAALPYRLEGYADRLASLFTAALIDLHTAPDLPRATVHLILPSWMEGHPELGHVENALADGMAVAGEEERPRLWFGDTAEALSIIGHAAAAVAKNETDAVIVGAADSLMHPALLDRLAMENRLLCRDNPNGAVPGEAACLVHLAAASAQPGQLGEVLAVFRGREPEDVREPIAVVGRGLAAAFRQAGEYAPVPDRLLSDMNGERWRAEEFGFAASGVGGCLPELSDRVEVPALHLGDCGAATGLLLLALALGDPPRQTHGTGTGRLAMVSASSRSGLRTVAVVERLAAAGEDA